MPDNTSLPSRPVRNNPPTLTPVTPVDYNDRGGPALYPVQRSSGWNSNGYSVDLTPKAKPSPVSSPSPPSISSHAHDGQRKDLVEESPVSHTIDVSPKAQASPVIVQSQSPPATPIPPITTTQRTEAPSVVPRREVSDYEALRTIEALVFATIVLLAWYAYAHGQRLRRDGVIRIRR